MYRQERNAVRIGVIALAGETRRKQRPDLERKLLVLGRGDAAQGLDAFTPHERDPRVVWKALLALDHEFVDLFLLLAPIPAAHGREHLLAVVAGYDPDAHPLGDSVHSTGGVLHDRLLFGLSVQPEDEYLVLNNRGTFIGIRSTDGRSAGGEGELLSTNDLCSRKSADVRFQRELADDARGQVVIEVVYPVLTVGPALSPFFRACDLKRLHETQVAEGNYLCGE